jgi:hypothetical protein
MLDSQSTAQFSSDVAGRLAAHISARVANVYWDCAQVFSLLPGGGAHHY